MTSSDSSIAHDKRSDALPPPPEEAICKALKISSVKVDWLAGDGSDRCYYRLSSDDLKERSLVLMQLSESDAKKLREDGYDWLHVAKVLDDAKIPYPRAKVSMPDYAALIIQDYGDVMLESVVMNQKSEQDIIAWYERCYDILAQMIEIKGPADVVWRTREFDFEKYQWELQFFKRQYLDQATDIKLDESLQEAFDYEVDQLAKYLAPLSTYFCHRDFHSRNIMVRGDELALIDFQDARLGSPVYDLVSLIYDNYVPLAKDFRRNLLTMGLQAMNLGELDHEHLGAVILQRQIKAIGTYGFLTKAKQRGDYLIYVKPALESLPMDLIYNEKWPFLSKHLIELMAK